MATQAIEKRGRGRPPIPYDHEIAMEICEIIACSDKSLQAILASDERFPTLHTAMRWLNSNADFSSTYARAKELQADFLADQMLEIADETNGDAVLCYDKEGKPFAKMDGHNVQRSKLMVEQRRWHASKLNPRRYGDKLDVTSGGEALPAMPPVMIDARVQTIMLLAEQRRRQEEEARNLLEE
jgi:hypothetical protein